MGTISPALDRPHRTAAVIATEDEAITVAGTIAGLFDTAEPGASTPETAEARLELLSRSGLFGVSIPTEHGGIDVSNTVLADICAAAAAHSATLGEILAAHFAAIERLRSHGTEGQRNTVFAAALAGARLARAAPLPRSGEPAETLPLAANGLAWRLSGDALCTPCTRHADWMLVPTRSDAGKTAGLLLPARVEGLRYVANSCEPAAGGAQPAEHVLFKDVAVDGDALLHAPGETARTGVPLSLEMLLNAARQLGAGRRALGRLLGGAEPDALTVGLLSARLAAAQAMIAEAGRAIDAAQIGLADLHRTNAFLAAAAALVTAQEAAGEARAAAERESEGQAVEGVPPALAALLEESGRLHLDAHRHPPEDEV